VQSTTLLFSTTSFPAHFLVCALIIVHKTFFLPNFVGTNQKVTLPFYVIFCDFMPIGFYKNYGLEISFGPNILNKLEV
jgi:hypothetical protein